MSAFDRAEDAKDAPLWAKALLIAGYFSVGASLYWLIQTLMGE